MDHINAITSLDSNVIVFNEAVPDNSCTEVKIKREVSKIKTIKVRKFKVVLDIINEARSNNITFEEKDDIDTEVQKVEDWVKTINIKLWSETTVTNNPVKMIDI